MKKTLRIFVALLVLSVFSSPAFADCGQCVAAGGGCSARSGRLHDGMSPGDSDKNICPIAAKVMMKAHFLLENADEIGLSADQTVQIKAIKMQTKKRIIQDGANMQLFMIDMESKLMEDKIDVEGLNAMIDQGSAGMIASGKESAKAYADIKALLTPDQMAKAKAIWTGGKKKDK